MIILRDQPSLGCTYGKLYDDQEKYFCETLEPSSPIPGGLYTCRLRFSPHRGYAVFGLLNVPGHSDIEIHPGNTPLDTKDCTLVGDSRGFLKVADTTYPAVLNSRITFQNFMELRGVPNFKSLTSWDLVRNFVLKYPTLETFSLEIK